MTWTSATAMYANVATLSLSDASKVITFSTAFPDTNYQVIAQLVNTTDTNPQFQPITITAKSTTGFTAKWPVGVDSANYSLSYIAMANA
jgi:hypothetical protein